jgi:hypothetical protein
LLFTNTIFSQESEEKDKTKEKPNQGLVFRLSEQDVILPVTSIEWGHPNRWSFTSRYIDSFEKRGKGEQRIRRTISST